MKLKILMKIKLSNPKIFVVTIIWLMVLVFFGTIEQKYIGLYEAQNKYFSSIILWVWYFPLPGGMLTMFFLTINLSAFLFKKNIWKKTNLGILTIHSGVMLLLLGSAITYFFSYEGAMQITTKNKNSNFIQSYHDKELAIINLNEFQDSIEYTNFSDKILTIGNTITHSTIPFEIEILNYCTNSKLYSLKNKNQLGKGDLAINNDIECINKEVEDSENKSAVKFYLKSKNNIYKNINGIYISRLSPNQNIQKITINNIEYVLILQPKRTYLPFTIELIDVIKISHPNTQIAKSYTSEINVLDNQQVRRQIIEMNAPLRYKGYTFYQAHYEEDQITGIKTSVFAVVKNYGRLFPYISSIIMCFGVLLQIIVRLPRLFKK